MHSHSAWCCQLCENPLPVAEVAPAAMVCAHDAPALLRHPVCFVRSLLLPDGDCGAG